MSRKMSPLKYLALAALVLAPAAPAAADPTADAVAKVAQGADCGNKKSAQKIWCPVGSWAKGKPHTMKAGFWIGFSVSIDEDTDLSTALTDDAALVIMRLDKDGPQFSANIKEIEGAPGVDTKMVDAVAAKARAALAGKGAIKLDGPLKTFADSLKGQGTRGMTRTKSAWEWTTGHSSAELREVGSTFIIVETPAGGDAGRTITILTDKVK